MQSKMRVLGLLGAALVVFSSGETSAQSVGEPAAAAHERITVYAPFVVTHKITNPMMSKTSATGIEVVTVSRSVSYADLNLSQSPDQITLENRVHQAAEEACKEIDRRYPKTTYAPIPANQDCVGTAVNQAMVIVKDLKDAASQDRGG